MFYHSPLPENFTNLGKSFSSFIQLCFFDNNLIKKKKKKTGWMKKPRYRKLCHRPCDLNGCVT